MKYLSLILGAFALLFTQTAQSQTQTIALTDGATIKVFQLQPESREGNKVNSKVAISYNKGSEDPVFGMMWISNTVSENNGNVILNNTSVSELKLPQLEAQKESLILGELRNKSSLINFRMSSNEFNTALQLYEKEQTLSHNIKNTAPRVIYAKKPSILVLVDGAPQYKMNDAFGVNMVVNSPFVIIQHTDGKHYIYGGKHWYASNSLKGNYSLTTQLPSKIAQIEPELRKMQEQNDQQGAEEYDENTIYEVLVSTEPAELIQSNGEASFAPVAGTNLLYVENSNDDIFMDIQSQQYYVLLSGRWYTGKSLTGDWKYVGSDQLPADFAKIIEGSSKDNVLASVAGTNAAKDALLDAQVPQTAKVDRNNTNANISYDGNPRFEEIEGTSMQYAVNSPSSVIRYKGRYYAVEDGVWFVSNSADGPWKVATDRPEEVALIPPSSPVYNVKYVYVYDVTPQYVYMGYTPGYLNTFIYGPTVVYGTGFYYSPWWGDFYYARPWTWGFGIRYNPWMGWGFGINYYNGWFCNPWTYRPFYGGWWGPRVYRPAYVYHPHNYRAPGMVRSGYYSAGYYNNYRTQIARSARNNNIYNYRRDVVTSNRGSVVARNATVRTSPDVRTRNTATTNRVARTNGAVQNQRTTRTSNSTINRSYRSEEYSRNNAVTPNRNSGTINREYRNTNQNPNARVNSGQTQRSSSGNSGVVTPGNRTTNPRQAPSARADQPRRPQVAENRSSSGTRQGAVSTPARTAPSNNTNRSSVGSGSSTSRPAQSTQQRVSAPRSSTPQRSVQSNNSSGSSVRSSGTSSQRSSGSSVRGSSGSSSSRSSGSGPSRPTRN